MQDLLNIYCGSLAGQWGSRDTRHVLPCRLSKKHCRTMRFERNTRTEERGRVTVGPFHDLTLCVELRNPDKCFVFDERVIRTLTKWHTCAIRPIYVNLTTKSISMNDEMLRNAILVSLLLFITDRMHAARLTLTLKGLL